MQNSSVQSNPNFFKLSLNNFFLFDIASMYNTNSNNFQYNCCFLLPDRNSARVKRGGLNSSGSNTPIGRGSRSSSVASAHNRKASASAVTPKIKTKLGRGYNPSLVNYKDSEYHYGSDFEDDGEEDNEEQASEHSSDEVSLAFLC